MAAYNAGHAVHFLTYPTLRQLREGCITVKVRSHTLLSNVTELSTLPISVTCWSHHTHHVLNKWFEQMIPTLHSLIVVTKSTKYRIKIRDLET